MFWVPLARGRGELCQHLPGFTRYQRQFLLFTPLLCQAGSGEEEDGGRKAPAGQSSGAW